MSLLCSWTHPGGHVPGRRPVSLTSPGLQQLLWLSLFWITWPLEECRSGILWNVPGFGFFRCFSRGQMAMMGLGEDYLSGEVFSLRHLQEVTTFGNLKKKKSIRRHTLKIPKSSQVKVLLLLFVCYCCCCCCFLNKKRPNLGAWDSCWITLNCACGCMSRTRTNEPSSVSSACLRKCPLFWQVFGKMNDFPGRDKILLKP